MTPSPGLDGKVVLLTGAAHGVGAATSRALVDAGASVSLLDVAHGPLHELAATLGDNAHPHVADVTDVEAMSDAVRATINRFGRIDVVVANAGVEVLDWADELSPDDFRRVVDVNLVGVWNTISPCLDELIRRKGYILIVSSLAGVTNGPMNSAYNASKAGAVALARTLRLELSSVGVAVGVAYLTYTDTPTARRSVEDPRMQSILRAVRVGSLTPIPVETVARRYVRAIERRERRLLFDRSSRLAVAMPELAQAMVERLMGPAVARARAARSPATDPRDMSDADLTG